jgi:hypothetical protein
MRFHKFELSPSGIDLRLVRKNQVGCRRCFHSIHQVNAETNSRDKPYGSLRKISVNYLSVPFSEHFEQPATIAQRVNGLLLVRRFDGIFKPGGYAWSARISLRVIFSFDTAPV